MLRLSEIELHFVTIFDPLLLSMHIRLQLGKQIAHLCETIVL